MQQEARRLHYPFYIVVAKDYGGSTTEELSDSIDALVDDWAKNSKFDRAKTSVAVLTYSPRKFRLLAGSTWRAKLGLEGQEGSQRFVDIFSSYVQGSSKDPKTGIIESMKALDEFVFENSDPKRIALRAAEARIEQAKKAEAERKAQAEQQLRSAERSLEEQIARAEALLRQTTFLPPDVSEPTEALARAKTARSSQIVSELSAAAERLRHQIDPLEAFVSAKERAYRAKMVAEAQARQAVLNAKRAEEARQQRQQAEIYGCILAVIFLTAALLFWQWRRYSSLKSRFNSETRTWEEALFNAADNHARFFEERQNVTELAATTGRTKEKYDEVTREVGAIYPTIEAMRDRIAQCKTVFSAGSFFKLKPFRQALELLDADFEFDTESLNRKSLFEPPVRIIKIKPAELQSQLNLQYAENIADWDQLMQALAIRQTVAQDAFPATDLTAALELADRKKIPHRWLAAHPLFGDDESDRRFYEDLNALRLTDPLAYKERIEAARQTQSRLNDDLARLIAALASIDSKRVAALPDYAETVVRPDSDPALSFAAANRADAATFASLATATKVEEIENQALNAVHLFETALEQTSVLQTAISETAGALQHLEDRVAALRQLHLDAESRLAATAQVHADTSAPATSLQSARKYLESATLALNEAKRTLEEKRHLEAHLIVSSGDSDAEAAERDFKQSLRLCDQLDEQKRAYDVQVAQLEAARADAESRLRQYGRRTNLGEFSVFNSSGPANYGLMIGQINSYRQELEDEVRRARLAHEEEMARIAREEEAERQRQRDAERRRDWASSSSHHHSSHGSSSSSGSSWSGRSSSSSGTDW